MNSDETGHKIALTRVLLAGCAYFCVSILTDIFYDSKKNTDSAKSGRKRRVGENQTTIFSVKEEVDAPHCLNLAYLIYISQVMFLQVLNTIITFLLMGGLKQI